MEPNANSSFDPAVGHAGTPDTSWIKKTQDEALAEEAAKITLPLDCDAFEALKPPHTRWIMNLAIPFPGLVAISGRPGSFKTFFALWVAIRAASGLPLFDEYDEPYFTETASKEPLGAVGTLFIEEENTISLIHERFMGMRSKNLNRNLHFLVDQGFSFQNDLWRQAIKEYVKLHKIRLIVVDPFSSVMGLKDENDNAEVARVMDLIRKDFIANDVTVIFLHHPSKGEDNAASLRGAGDIVGKCDVHLTLEKDKLDPCLIKVSYAKMRVASANLVADFQMRFTGEAFMRDMHFRYVKTVGSRTKEEKTKLATEILAILKEDEEYGKDQIAKRLGQNYRSVKFSVAFDQLVKDGDLKETLNTKNGHSLFRKNNPT